MDEQHSDRISLETRIIGALVILVLLLAFVALYIDPTHTDQDFAWTILPPTSAILMGAGYTAGAYFFARAVTERKWHRVQAGFLPITAFTVCMLAATVLHWGRFHHGQLVFYLWFVIYLITPVAVPFLWWRNRTTAAQDLEERDVRFSRWLRMVLGIAAGGAILAFVIVYAIPSILITLAPWKLTELTARVFAGWSILTLASVVSIAIDGRWSATRILMQAAMVGLILTLLALPRMWCDLDHANPMSLVFIAGIIATLVGFLAVHIGLDAAAHRKLRTSDAVENA